VTAELELVPTLTLLISSVRRWKLGHAYSSKSRHNYVVCKRLEVRQIALSVGGRRCGQWTAGKTEYLSASQSRCHEIHQICTAVSGDTHRVRAQVEDLCVSCAVLCAVPTLISKMSRFDADTPQMRRVH